MKVVLNLFSTCWANLFCLLSSVQLICLDSLFFLSNFVVGGYTTKFGFITEILILYQNIFSLLLELKIYYPVPDLH